MEIDIESERICAIKANSPSKTMRALTRTLADNEISLPHFQWRVSFFLIRKTYHPEVNIKILSKTWAL